MKKCIALFAILTTSWLQCDILKTEIWESYLQNLRNDPQRIAENTIKDYKYQTLWGYITSQVREIHYQQKTMRFITWTKGDKPQTGYPLYIYLHGGGGAPSKLNNSQWAPFNVWKDSMEIGKFIAVRGIADTWNLHFRKNSYVMYDRMIENMIAFEDVDPNRVYLFGFSAGGDGVYQIAPRMADRFAAVCMMAGHSNGTRVENCRNLPFLIQMGGRDKAYGRNIDAANNYEKFKNLGYPCEIYIHPRGNHNNWMMKTARLQDASKVIQDPLGWRDSKNKSTAVKNTSSIGWLKKHNRTSLPDRITWLKGMQAPLRTTQFYWLDLGPSSDLHGDVDVEIVKSENLIKIHKCGEYLRLLINNKMLNSNKPVQIVVDSQTFEVNLTPHWANQIATISQRGDINYMFSAIVDIQKTVNGWTVENKILEIPNIPSPPNNKKLQLITATSYENWLQQILNAEKIIENIGIFNLYRQCVNGSMKSKGQADRAKYVFYICLNGTGAKDAKISMSSSTCLGWDSNQNSFAKTIADEVNGNYWYRLEVNHVAAQQTEFVVSNKDKSFKIWAFR